MTEQQISAAINELVALVGQGKPMEAFDRFYHDDLEKTDWNAVPHQGKP